MIADVTLLQYNYLTIYLFIYIKFRIIYFKQLTKSYVEFYLKR